MSNGNMQFSTMLTIWKGVTAFIKAALVITAGGTAAGSIALPEETMKELVTHWPAFAVVIPALLAVLAIVENIRKNYCDDGQPIWEWPWNKLRPTPKKLP